MMGCIAKNGDTMGEQVNDMSPDVIPTDDELPLYTQKEFVSREVEVWDEAIQKAMDVVDEFVNEFADEDCHDKLIKALKRLKNEI